MVTLRGPNVCALDAIRASVASDGKCASLVPVDGEEREALLTELCGVCEHQSPVDRNGDTRFIGTDPDGAYWRVALLAVPRKPCSRSVKSIWAEYHELARLHATELSTDSLTAVVLAHQNARDAVREDSDSWNGPDLNRR